MHERQISSQIARYFCSSSLVRAAGGAIDMQVVPTGKAASVVGEELLLRALIVRLAWSGEKRLSRLGI